MPTASSQQDMHVSHYQTNAGESSKRKKTPDLFFFFLVLFCCFPFPVHNSAIVGQLAEGFGDGATGPWDGQNVVPWGFVPAALVTLSQSFVPAQ